MTLRAQYAQGLLALGYRLDHTNTSRKYELYVLHGGSPTYFWLGLAGAVRYGSIKRFDASIAATDKTKSVLLAKATGA